MWTDLLWYCRNDRGPLATDLQAFQQLFVRLEVMSLDIVEKFAATAGHRNKTATTVKVLAVGSEVVGEVRDALREQSNLDLGRTGIRIVSLEVGDYRRFIQL